MASHQKSSRLASRLPSSTTSMNCCWEEGTVHQDMCEANIITLYKNKGDHSDCNNYCGLSLLSIVGKAFTCMVLNQSTI